MTDEQKPGKKRLWTIIIISILAVGAYIGFNKWHDSKEYNYYAYYVSVKGLQASSPVELKGVRVGKITDIELHGENLVKVSIEVKKTVPLLNGTVALLVSNGLMGDKSIRLVEGTGPGTIADNAEIPTAFDTSVMPGSVQVIPYVERAKAFIRSADSTVDAMNIMVHGGLEKKTSLAIIAFEEKTRKYAALGIRLNRKGDSIVRTIQSVHTSAAKAAANNNNLNQSIGSIEQKTRRLASSSMKGRILEIQANVRSIKTKVSSINNSDTGLGKHVNTKATYTHLSQKMDSMNTSMKELQAHPPGFSILGRKKKK
jgi:phospholipid/cholesterol/gamma-HCH transport system substrate-binding protein